jgi:glutamate synthase domain-containing protein 2
MDASSSEKTPNQAAQYIASLTHELVQIARRNRLDTLRYLLEMARLEADQLIKR